MADHTPKKYPSLRFFITVTIMIIVGFVLLLSVGFYYIKTSSILRKTSRDSIVRELNQVNDTIQNQIETIDSIIPLFMSNEVARSAVTYTRTIFTFLGLFFKPVDDTIFNKKKSLYSPEGQLAGL